MYKHPGNQIEAYLREKAMAEHRCICGCKRTDHAPVEKIFQTPLQELAGKLGTKYIKVACTQCACPDFIARDSPAGKELIERYRRRKARK